MTEKTFHHTHHPKKIDGNDSFCYSEENPPDGYFLKDDEKKVAFELNEELIKEKEKVFILGGPMMGASIPSDDAVITKTVTSIIVLNKTNYKEEPCVRCGSCVLSCPVGLEPVSIMNAVKAVDKERIKALNPLKCIECGLCAYSCTSKIQVTDFVRKAKIFAKL